MTDQPISVKPYHDSDPDWRPIGGPFWRGRDDDKFRHETHEDGELPHRNLVKRVEERRPLVWARVALIKSKVYSFKSKQISIHKQFCDLYLCLSIP